MREEIIRGLIHDENEMTNHRMNWFLILQGFLFAGIAFAWEKSIGLVIVFSGVGILSSLSVGLLLHLGIDAIKNLQREASEIKGKVVGKKAEEVSKFVHFEPVINFVFEA
ncbi:hypothetical protein [Ferrigenium sp. UT5]|uniref:hypothetical protein n=1 Tax=Ferrigenium sp. UT5 TaxID=3242105 RepID=UPI0035501CAD